MSDPTAAQLYSSFEQAFISGGDHARRQSRLMLAIAEAISRHGHVPEPLKATLLALKTAWMSDEAPDPNMLIEARLAIWGELEAKNGNSTTIADLTDRTLRASLCLAETIDPGEAMETAGWAAEMLSSEPWPRQTTYF